MSTTEHLRNVAVTAQEASCAAAKGNLSPEIASLTIAGAIEDAILADRLPICTLQCLRLARRVNMLLYPNDRFAILAPANESTYRAVPYEDEMARRSDLLRAAAAVLMLIAHCETGDVSRGAEILFDWIDSQGHLPGIDP